ncbi:hypothetical protein ACFX2I_025447 [Malus domestica]
MNSTTTPRTVKVARQDYWGTICPPTFVNTTLNFSLFDYDSGYTNMTFYYQCNTSIRLPTAQSCNIHNTVSPVFYAARSMVVQTSSAARSITFSLLLWALTIPSNFFHITVTKPMWLSMGNETSKWVPSFF